MLPGQKYYFLEVTHNKLQEELNDLAAQWKVVSMAAGGPAGSTIYVILEKR